jgi:GTP-binding protein
MQMDALRSVAGKDAVIIAISSTAHQHLTELLRLLKERVEAAKAAAEETEDEETSGLPVISLSAEAKITAWLVTKDGDTFVVRGDKIEKFARRTNFDQYEGINRLRDIMRKMGITHELARQGAVGNSIIRIGIDEFPLLEQLD